MHAEPRDIAERDTGTGTDRIRIGTITGDGIGHEIVPATLQVVAAAIEATDRDEPEPLRIEWVPLHIGHDAIERYGTPLPDETMDSLAALPGWILGPHDNVSYPERFAGTVAPGGAIRRRFDLFANIRPARAFAGVAATSPRMDLVVVRENTEGLYADRNMSTGSGEFMPTPDVALAVGLVTRRATERIARVAFGLARERRRRVTIVHKANVLTLTTGLFRDVCREVARDYPDVTVDDMHVDAAAARLVRDGASIDVLVTENMFGDILSDLTAELAGSLGLAPSINASTSQVMAQAAHGAAPDIAGRGVANPAALMLSAAMMFDRLGEMRGDRRLRVVGRHVDRAVRDTIASGVATADLGGSASTTEFTETVLARALRW
ncbi:isocitrate/isopropylmalate dehydrogenase family protein [Rhodococcus rhodnii]|nr:isocitrate/isopropylmalate dehydrogenase family protein [Rhodococcus rhodnii]TXG92745.1 isocitrate/isopropylmalate dehydrogenase family protein [Rhodococcus rhodnii]